MILSNSDVVGGVSSGVSGGESGVRGPSKCVKAPDLYPTGPVVSVSLSLGSSLKRGAVSMLTSLILLMFGEVGA